MLQPQLISVLDSVAYAKEADNGHIIISGSHGGESAAKHLLLFSPTGAIFNDAGIGKNCAGISGLLLLDEVGIPAATVDAFSAEIGNGKETYEEGVISIVNRAASRCGIEIGIPAKGAALLMLKNIKEP